VLLAGRDDPHVEIVRWVAGQPLQRRHAPVGADDERVARADLRQRVGERGAPPLHLRGRESRRLGFEQPDEALGDTRRRRAEAGGQAGHGRARYFPLAATAAFSTIACGMGYTFLTSASTSPPAVPARA